MNKRGIVAIVTGTLVISSEIAYATEDQRRRVADAPHSHIELPADLFVNVLSPISASGQGDTVLYRVQFAPAQNSDGQTLGYKAIGLPESGWQRMSAQFDTLDALMEALDTEMALPQPQLDAIRRTLLAGGVAELGGIVPSAVFMVDARALRRLGLRFGGEA